MSFKRCRSWIRLIASLAASCIILLSLNVAVVAASSAVRVTGPGADHHRARISRYLALRRAPLLAVSGKTLKWARVNRLDHYLLKSKAPGRPAKYAVVRGTSVTPPPVPGAIVHYSVRTTAHQSAWAPERSISYPPVAAVSAPTTTVSPLSSTEPAAPGPSSEPAGGEPSSSATSVPEPVISPTLPPEALGESFVRGVAIDPVGWGEGAAPEIAGEVHSLGAEWVRTDLPWKEVMPSPGVYDWSHFDAVMRNSEALGLHVLPILGYAPSWTTPTNAAGYAEFVAAAVARYGPGTTANLHWFELWNEPYDSYAWSGKTPEPEAYARDVAAAAEAAKKIAPSVKFLIAAEYNDSAQTGGSSPWETTWISDMFTAVPDLGKLIDGVAVHPYGDDPALPLAEPGGWKDTSGGWSFQRIDTTRAQFLAHGVNVPFWITEVGYSTYGTSEAEQAHDYADLITQVADRPWVRGLFAYCLREYEEHATNDESPMGLLKFGSWQPKSAFYTLQQGFKTLS